MKYSNLRAEMAKSKITIEELSEFLGVHRNTIANKIENGRFYADEAFKIQKKYFPLLTIDFLFNSNEEMTREKAEVS